MHVARGFEQLRPSGGPIFVVVGVFDGLHLGHAYLLDHLVKEARARGARPVVVTFDHHPDEILTGSAPPLLCDPEERLERLARAGVETTVVVHFDRHLRETTYGAFVALIEARAPLAGFLMTPDAAFGYQRAGTPEALARLGAARGFEVIVVPPFALAGAPVRSSEVRSAIAAGDLDGAAALLGRPHAVVGAVEEGSGDAAGIRLRFALPVALPPDGPYTVAVGPEGASVPGIARIEAGALRVGAAAPGPRVRVAFLARGG